jgi:hypothetical protein
VPRLALVHRLQWWILPAAIALLALLDGTIHLSLDFLLFRGNLFGSFGPPPGAPPPGANPPPQLPLSLNRLFVLNFVGYVVFAALVWFGRTRLPRWMWLVDVALLVYIFLIVAGWVTLRNPNPMGLGYLTKAIEVVLVLVTLAHLWLTLQSNRPVEQVSTG